MGWRERGKRATCVCPSLDSSSEDPGAAARAGWRRRHDVGKLSAAAAPKAGHSPSHPGRSRSVTGLIDAGNPQPSRTVTTSVEVFRASWNFSLVERRGVLIIDDVEIGDDAEHALLLRF